MPVELAWRLLALLLVSIGSQFAWADSSTTDRTTMPIAFSAIQVTLEVHVDGRRIPTVLRFHNSSQEKAFLYKPIACAEQKISQNVFRIGGAHAATGDAGGAAYTGPYMKLRAPEPADFIELAPGATFSVGVDPSTAYELPAGPGRYTIRYVAMAPSAGRPGDLAQMQSDPVSFELR